MDSTNNTPFKGFVADLPEENERVHNELRKKQALERLRAEWLDIEEDPTNF